MSLSSVSSLQSLSTFAESAAQESITLSSLDSELTLFPSPNKIPIELIGKGENGKISLFHSFTPLVYCLCYSLIMHQNCHHYSKGFFFKKYNENKVMVNHMNICTLFSHPLFLSIIAIIIYRTTPRRFRFVFGFETDHSYWSRKKIGISCQSIRVDQRLPKAKRIYA